MKSLLRSWSVFGLFLALFSASCFSVLSADYGVSDDYPDLVTESLDPPEYAIAEQVMVPGSATTKKIQEGRPLYALVAHLLFQTTADIGDLRRVRFAGILGISLLAWIMYRILVRTGHDRFQSFCAGAIACSTLPFQLYASSVTLAPFPFAAVLSGFALILGDRAFTTPGRLSKWLQAGGAGVVLLAALAIYQPAAMFFWVFAAVILLEPNRTRRDVFRRLGWYCLIASFGLVPGYGLAELGPTLYPDRTGLVQDVPGKLAWFLFTVFPQAVNFALLSPSHWLLSDGGATVSSASRTADVLAGWMFFIVISAGLVLYLRGRRNGAPWKYGVAVSLLFASHMPNLAVESVEAGYRTMAALSSLVVLYAYLAVKGFARPYRHRSSFPLANVIMGAAAIACVLSAAHHVRTWIVEPQVRELEFMRDELTRHDLSGVGRIYVIRPAWWSTLAPLVHREFGYPSSAPWWNPYSMVFLILRETAPEHARLPVTSVGFDQPMVPLPGSLVVDMSHLGKAPGSSSFIVEPRT